MNCEVTCVRCHNRISMKYSEVSRYLKCPHCNQKMKINAVTQRREKRVSIVIVIIVAAVLFWGMKSFEKGNYYIMILGMTLATSLLVTVDKLCLMAVARLHGLEYEEYHSAEAKTKKR